MANLRSIFVSKILEDNEMRCIFSRRQPQNEDDLKIEDNLKNEGNLKNEEDLKNEDNLKNKDNL